MTGLLTAVGTATKAAILALLLGAPGALLVNVSTAPVPIRYGFVPLFVTEATVPGGQGQVLASVPSRFPVGAQAPLSVNTGAFAGTVRVTASAGLNVVSAAPAEVYSGATYGITTEPLMGTTLNIPAVTDGVSALWYVSAAKAGTYTLTVRANGVAKTVAVHVAATSLGTVIVGQDGVKVIRDAAQVVPEMNQRMLSLQNLGL